MEKIFYNYVFLAKLVSYLTVIGFHNKNIWSSSHTCIIHAEHLDFVLGQRG